MPGAPRTITSIWCQGQWQWASSRRRQTEGLPGVVVLDVRDGTWLAAVMLHSTFAWMFRSDRTQCCVPVLLIVQYEHISTVSRPRVGIFNSFQSINDLYTMRSDTPGNSDAAWL